MISPHKILFTMMPSSYLAGVAARRQPESIEMIQVVLGRSSGAPSAGGVWPQHHTARKSTIISLMLILFAIGCSKKESASELSRFALGHGDITP
jgi:hypothetical protein